MEKFPKVLGDEATTNTGTADDDSRSSPPIPRRSRPRNSYPEYRSVNNPPPFPIAAGEPTAIHTNPWSDAPFFASHTTTTTTSVFSPLYPNLLPSPPRQSRKSSRATLKTAPPTTEEAFVEARSTHLSASPAPAHPSPRQSSSSPRIEKRPKRSLQDPLQSAKRSRTPAEVIEIESDSDMEEFVIEVEQPSEKRKGRTAQLDSVTLTLPRKGRFAQPDPSTVTLSRGRSDLTAPTADVIVIDSDSESESRPPAEVTDDSHSHQASSEHVESSNTISSAAHKTTGDEQDQADASGNFKGTGDDDDNDGGGKPKSRSKSSTTFEFLRNDPQCTAKFFAVGSGGFYNDDDEESDGWDPVSRCASACSQSTCESEQDKKPSALCARQYSTRSESLEMSRAIEESKATKPPPFYPRQYSTRSESLEMMRAIEESKATMPQPSTDDATSRNAVDEFNKLWARVEQDFGNTCHAIEESALIRAANTKLAEGSDRQRSAQYGRILPSAMDRIFDALQLDAEHDIFVDLGHGLGNAVFQAAHTRNCRSRGIEVVVDRHACSKAFQLGLDDACPNKEKVGEIELRRGGLEDVEHTEFLTQGARIKAFCNNYGGVFGEKSMHLGSAYTLDDNVAGLFGLMPDGSILVSADKPSFMVPPQAMIAEQRRLAGLDPVEEAGFYNVETVRIGFLRDSVSWAATFNEKDFLVHKYTRVNEGSFLCWNPDCDNAVKGIRVQASRLDENSKCWVPNACPCGARSLMSLRTRRRAPALYNPMLELLRPQRQGRKELNSPVEDSASQPSGDGNPAAPGVASPLDDGLFDDNVSDDDSSSEDDQDSSHSGGGPEAETEQNVVVWNWENLETLPQPILEERSIKSFCQLWQIFESEFYNNPGNTLIAEARDRLKDRQVMPGLSSPCYGRVLPMATERILDACELDSDLDIFVDFGHGYGNIVLQAAFTRNCRARGIEVVAERHEYSVAYQVGFEKFQGIVNARFGVSAGIGKAELQYGCLEDASNMEFLTQGGRMKAFCNNFGGHLCYTKRGGDITASINLAGLFGLMPEGSILVTLHKLDFSVPSQNTIVEERRRQGLDPIEAAGFYTLEEVKLGETCDAVSWAAAFNQNQLIGYKYTRVNDGTFLCWNPECENAQNNVKMPASQLTNNKKSWTHCSCNCTARSLMSLRRNRR